MTENKPKILLIDNYDSFTYNLAQYLWELSYDCTVHRNDKITLDEIESANFSHIVVSPGPGRPEDSGISLSVIEKFYKLKPILGVCLGHQCLGQFFGGTVSRIPEPKHGKVSEIKHNSRDIFNGLKNPLKVTRYHSLVVKRETIDESKIEITAESLDDGYVMGLRHKEFPLYGVQFHPESIMTESGHQMLRNFVEQN